ncbi:ATP-binding protein [Actinacidiphila acididurans]|uniref:ATP-binding protein n=1 Tax=Actinacidiphila acididurans TaxID=2784346 RepID=A0ABS2TMD7_9ACTN|nr:ATP-binding protein [Actinacidiphila acididurans]MBM9504509.1 ATP-binding protein [Actinacidiphila acididurans]
MTAPPIIRPEAALPLPLSRPDSFSAIYPATRAAVPQARELTRALPPAVRDAAEIVVSELVTNAITHADTAAVTVTVAADDRGGAHVEVSDDDAAHLPHPVDPSADALGGRGLAIVECLCSDVHCCSDDSGKTIVADVRPNAAGAADDH